MLTEGLTQKNYKQHSLYSTFLEEVGDLFIEKTDPTNYELYEYFLTWLEDY